MQESRDAVAGRVSLGNGRVLDAVRGRGTGLGLVGLGAGRPRAVSGDGNGFATRYAEDFGYPGRAGPDPPPALDRVGPDRARARAPTTRPRSRTTATSWRPRTTPGSRPGCALHHFTLPALVRGAGAVSSTPEPARPLGPPRRLHGRDLRRPRRRVAAGERDQLLRVRSHYGGAAVPAEPRRPGRDGRGRRGDPARRAPRPRCGSRSTGAPVSLDLRAVRDRRAGRRPRDRHVRDRRSTTSFWRPGLGLFRDGVLRVPGRDPVERPDLAGRLRPDRLLVLRRDRRRGRAAGHPTAGRAGVAARLRDLGGGGRRGARPPARGRPGYAARSSPSTASAPTTTTSARRTSSAGSTWSHDAIGRGVDVRGFFHWTAVDNYEWLHGYDVPFGILDHARNVRPSAGVLAREALGTT